MIFIIKRCYLVKNKRSAEENEKKSFCFEVEHENQGIGCLYERKFAGEKVENTLAADVL